MSRYGECTRITKETSVSVKINLDEPGESSIDTGIGFFDHMLQLLAFHSKCKLVVKAKGDLEVDDHHTIEDVGICLGTAIRDALGDKKGIERYGQSLVPMDECLNLVSIDLSGRSFLVFDVEFTREKIGELSTEMLEEFFRALAFNCDMTLHIKCLYGSNDHHKAEGIFKAFARTLRDAVKITGTSLNTSKGVF